MQIKNVVLFKYLQIVGIVDIFIGSSCESHKSSDDYIPKCSLVRTSSGARYLFVIKTTNQSARLSMIIFFFLNKFNVNVVCVYNLLLVGQGHYTIVDKYRKIN